MSRHPEHLRRHAQQHHEAHQELKRLLKSLPAKETVWHWFAATFMVSLVAIGLYLNRGALIGLVTPPAPPELPGMHGFLGGARSVMAVDRQANIEYDRYLKTVIAQGGPAGVKTTHTVGYSKPKPIETTLNLKSVAATRAIAYAGIPAPYTDENVMRTAVWTTSYLSKGHHLTPVRETRNLQKSLIATYYLGEKSPGIEDALSFDTRLLRNMKEALSVDLFQYLNQADSRADALAGYLNLLEQLREQGGNRVNDLQSNINFLEGSATGLSTRLDLSEKTFFDYLERLDSTNAEQNLAEFIEIRQDESEVKAKLGAYLKLRSFYQFFLPRLTALANEIRLNRDPLIAGVKVVEVQNMSLPLIIRGQ